MALTTASPVLLLQRWLVIVAALRTYAVYLGFFDPQKLAIALINNKPELVNDLYGRLFGTWTALTCILCLVCSRNPTNPAIYGATMASFVVALLYFAIELFVYQTTTWKGVLTPSIIAGLSTIWMGAGWNYYTIYCKADDAAGAAAKVNGPDAVKADGKEL